MNENVKTVSVDFITGSRNISPMMRGVSCELASCTATSRAEETKTMKVNSDEVIVVSTVRAVSVEGHVIAQRDDRTKSTVSIEPWQIAEVYA